MHHYGIISLVPPLIAVLIAIRTRLSLEPLIIACVVGYIIVAGWGFFDAIIASFTKVMQNDLMVWVIIVCSLYGALIQLMIRSGGVSAFGHYMLRFVGNRKKSLLATWLFASCLFVDDYLNALTSGNTMKKITDHYNIPREMLAFVVSSTAVPVCVIVPISTWVIFIGKLLEQSNVVPAGKGIHSYLNIIPFISYGWVQFLVVPLVIVGIIPIIGKMKRANHRAATTRQLIPDNSEEFKVDVAPFDALKQGSIWYLILPTAVLLLCTVLFDLDALKGIITALVFTIFYFVFKKVASFKMLSESAIEGMKSMLFALVLLLLSYLLKNLGDEMGLTQYVIQVVQPIVSKQWLPLAIFISLGAIAFSTGNSWGLYAIAIPLVVPLAQALQCNMWLCIGAVISAGAFGAHACFYSDATILAAQGTECNNYEHAITQLPFALISFTLSCVIYIALGFAMA
ncbi:Na+/H+ antiporter NhaC family protein [Foetidibacter luteolus]|uniref:Na+/H+ antiporter NhaC family protein n=1 Tax=Foetidibacter luteolus TaxID=2608880 RepID=UPI00129A76C2|nr:Na+/H+ antiporter NhaC family protein [Foetidibacter luteolus]